MYLVVTIFFQFDYIDIIPIFSFKKNPIHLIIFIHFSTHFSHNFFPPQKTPKNHLEIHGASHLAGDDVRDDIQGLGLGRGFEAPRILRDG